MQKKKTLFIENIFFNSQNTSITAITAQSASANVAHTRTVRLRESEKCFYFIS